MRPWGQAPRPCPRTTLVACAASTSLPALLARCCVKYVRVRGCYCCCCCCCCCCGGGDGRCCGGVPDSRRGVDKFSLLAAFPLVSQTGNAECAMPFLTPCPESGPVELHPASMWCAHGRERGWRVRRRCVTRLDSFVGVRVILIDAVARRYGGRARFRGPIACFDFRAAPGLFTMKKVMLVRGWRCRGRVARGSRV